MDSNYFRRAINNYRKCGELHPSSQESLQEDPRSRLRVLK